ncbi:hypothetical protein AB0M43_36505 [Longispora sp. NPDC051575]|uniref:hypothetical protein n=1 Tax=Longispora sp. NPDC051575 TaxID=3154943 RepID=UPI003421CC91
MTPTLPPGRIVWNSVSSGKTMTMAHVLDLQPITVELHVAPSDALMVDDVEPSLHSPVHRLGLFGLGFSTRSFSRDPLWTAGISAYPINGRDSWFRARLLDLPGVSAEYALPEELRQNRSLAHRVTVDASVFYERFRLSAYVDRLTRALGSLQEGLRFFNVFSLPQYLFSPPEAPEPAEPPGRACVISRRPPRAPGPLLGSLSSGFVVASPAY